MLTLQCRRGQSESALATTLGYYQPSVPPPDARPGVWAGTAAALLVFSGPVASMELRRALMGHDPRSDIPLVHRSGVDRRYAWDLTFSAPKSVSLLWAAARPEVRLGIERAHVTAIVSLLASLETTYVLGRRGRNGTQKEPVRLLFAVFPHFVSREGDPQIHSHVLLMNLACYPDHRWGGLDPKILYRDQQSLGGRYRQNLARQLESQGFPLEVTEGTIRVPGISPEVEAAFSRRHRQIVEKKKTLGVTGGRASVVASLSTRRDKFWHSLAEVEAEWRERLEALGVTSEFVEDLRMTMKERDVPATDRSPPVSSAESPSQVPGWG